MRWPMLALGVSAYATALIVTAPATLADAGLQGASDGRLRLADAQGTLWSGTGQIEIAMHSGRTGLGKRLAWRLRPGALLRAALAYMVALGPEPRSFPVTISWSRIEIENADISLPAQHWVWSISTLAPLSELTGEVQLQLSSGSIGAAHRGGNGTWGSASCGVPPARRSRPSPLGDYVNCASEGLGPAVRVTLHTLQGPLQLDGQGSWANGAKPVFLATAQECRPNSLATACAVSAPDRRGARRWKLRGCSSEINRRIGAFVGRRERSSRSSRIVCLLGFNNLDVSAGIT